MEYVLLLFYDGNKNVLGFYSGKKYTHQGEMFACSTDRPESAKKYTSKKRAEMSFRHLKNSVSNAFDYSLFFRAASNNKFEPTRE